MPLTRTTIRRLMFAMAILALLLRAVVWVGEMRVRSRAHRKRAADFAWSTLRQGKGLQRPDGRWVDLCDDENTIRHDAWARQMADKYLWLSYHPWSTAEPDPPPPEPLARPRRAIDLPEAALDRPKAAFEISTADGLYLDLDGPRPPFWTYLWTWPP